MRLLKLSSARVLVLLLIGICVMHGCAKKTEGQSDCKTCVGKRSGFPDIVRDVCSETDESNFKGEHTAYQVTCE